jgi:hypothetical protein
MGRKDICWLDLVCEISFYCLNCNICPSDEIITPIGPVNITHLTSAQYTLNTRSIHPSHQLKPHPIKPVITPIRPAASNHVATTCYHLTSNDNYLANTSYHLNQSIFLRIQRLLLQGPPHGRMFFIFAEQRGGVIEAARMVFIFAMLIQLWIKGLGLPASNAQSMP